MVVKARYYGGIGAKVQDCAKRKPVREGGLSRKQYLAIEREHLKRIEKVRLINAKKVTKKNILDVWEEFYDYL